MNKEGYRGLLQNSGGNTGFLPQLTVLNASMACHRPALQLG